MAHSIIISGKNTYDEWGLVPKTRPVIAMPSVKTHVTDLPAAHGQLDYTGYLLSEVPYGQRTGTWEFVLRPRDAWASVYSGLANYLHGKRHTVILEDDPAYQYVGRLAVNEWKSEAARSQIAISYDLDPFKYSTEDSADTDWLWDDLFTDCIKYGTFTVSGTKHRNIVNNGSRPAVPTFTCTASMTVEFGGDTYGLVAGRNHNLNLALQAGDNVMVFHGYGDVTVSFREVSL